MHIIKYPEKRKSPSEGIIIAWDKKAGDTVKNGDLLVKIEVSGEWVEIESPVEGTLLKTLADTGQPVRSGEPLAVIGEPGEDTSKVLGQLEQKQAASEKRAPEPQPQPKAAPAVEVQSVQTDNLNRENAMTSQESTGNPDNVIPILMPQAGQSMEEGTILSWKVKEGDTIEVGQVIMEIETDKATMDVEATDAGRIARIVAAEGAVVEVKKPVAFLAENDADVEAHLGGTQKEAPDKKESRQATPASVTSSVETQPKATPANEVQQTQSKKEEAVASQQSSGTSENVIPIIMPQAGQSMEEGTILSWKVKEGDTIEVGQVIMEIETDKATMEVEAVNAGRIARIVAAEGDVVEVKKPVAYLAEEGVDIEGHFETGGTSAPAQEKAGIESESGRVKASPAARKKAADMGVELKSMDSGSGPGGRILSSDVEKADTTPAETKVQTLSKMRRAIANNLLYSKQNIPHFYAKTTIDAGALFATYRKTKEQFKCTVNDFVTRACAKAIREYPAFRSQYKDNGIAENASVNIGIAVGTDQGLTVPVVVGADKMKLEQLAARTREVVESARNGKLEGMGQGVFTITNLGMFGVEEFAAIINPPESAILAVGAIREGVVVENEQIRPTRLMSVTLSVDHRVIDGVVAAQFLKTLKDILEKPEQLVS